MRYAKGSLTISQTRDLPLLLQVRNSKFISHQQLYELMMLGNYEHSRKSFNWRIRRLVDSKHVLVCPSTFGRGTIIYQIAKEGLQQLENSGEFAAVLNSTTHHMTHLSQVHHSLELNSVRIALAKAQLLAGWQCDVETASANTISGTSLAKDYDALVDVWNGKQLCRFALEYERTLKSKSRYKEIRLSLEQDAQIGCVLYLTSGFDITLHLASELGGISKRLAFAAIPTFRQRLLDTQVLTHPNRPEIPFRDLLFGMF